MPSLRVLAPGLLLAALLTAPASPARAADPAAPPARVETDDEALKDLQRAVKARDVQALLGRVSGLGVELGADNVVSPGYLKKHLALPDSAPAQWVFGPRRAPKGEAAPWSLAACLASRVELSRTGTDTAEVRCQRGTRWASFGLTRLQGRWTITRGFFWPDDAVR